MTRMTGFRPLGGVAAALTIVAGLAAPIQAQAQSLADTLVAAYNNSGLLEQNRALLRASDEDLAQTVASLRPVVSYVADASWVDPLAFPGANNTSSSLGLQLSWLISDFGRTQLATDAQREVILATREALRNVEQQVLFRAVSAYAGVLSAQAVVQLSRNNVEVLEEQLRASQDRFEVGEVTRTDVSLTEAQLAAARAQLAAAQGTLDRAREEYRAATGIAADNLQQPPAAPATPATEDAGQALARQQAPALLQAQREVTVAELGVLVAEASLRPRLDLIGSTGVDNGFTSDFDDSSSVRLQLSGPIYQGGGLTSGIRQAQARRDAARGALINTQFAVTQAVANSYVNRDVADATIAATNAQVEASRLALEGAREEQQLGARTTLDVLILEQDFLDAETDRVTALTDRFVANFDILQAVGGLTVENLGLNVPTYDPAAYFNAVRGAPNTLVSPQGEQLDQVLRSLMRE